MEEALLLQLWSRMITSQANLSAEKTFCVKQNVAGM